MRFKTSQIQRLVGGGFILFALVVFASSAIAQTPTPQPAVKSSGVAATMVAAGLETAGYKMQSIILKDFKGILESLAILIYVASALFALAYYSVYGEFENALWFFLGPPIFHFVLLAQSTSAGVDWQVGDQEPIPPDGVNVEIGETVDASVSFLFDEYNKLISSIVQESVRIIAELGKEDGKEMRSQLVLMIRQQIFESLFRMRVEDDGLMALIHEGLNVQCAAEMEAARYVALGKRDPNFVGTSEYKEKLAVYEREFGPVKDSTVPVTNGVRHFNGVGKPTKKLKTPAAREYVKQLLVAVREKRNKDPKFAKDIAECVFENDLPYAELTYDRPVNCAQIWCWAAAGTRLHVSDQIANLDQAALSELKETEPGIYNEIWISVVRKMLPIPDIMLKIDGKDASMELTPEAREAFRELGIDEEDMDEALKEFYNVNQKRIEPDASIIPIVIAGTLLRKELTKNPEQSLLAQVAEHSGYKREEFDFQPTLTRDQIQEVVRRAAIDGDAHKKRYEIFTFANALPYLQGIFLYFLGLSFPFFALLVLIPGKAVHFFQWMGLWGWVKSWDIGWAIVMVADDVLWSLMPKSATYDVLIDPRHAPITVMESAFHGDPAYSLANYYTIISVMLLAVPIISAQAVMSGCSAIANTLTNGLNEMGTNFGMAAYNWTLHDRIAKATRLREMWAAKYTLSHMGESANSDLSDFKADIDSAQGRSWWHLAQGIAGAVAVGVGAGLMLTGVGAGAGAWLAVSGAGMAASGFRGFNKVRQDVHRAKASYNEANAMFHYFNSMSQDWYSNMEAIRGGLSGRGEFWNMADAAVGAQMQLRQARLTLTASTTQHHTEAIVGGALSLVPFGGKFLVSGFVAPAVKRTLTQGLVSNALRGGGQLVQTGLTKIGAGGMLPAVGRFGGAVLEHAGLQRFVQHPATQMIGNAGMAIGATYGASMMMAPVIEWMGRDKVAQYLPGAIGLPLQLTRGIHQQGMQPLQNPQFIE